MLYKNISASQIDAECIKTLAEIRTKTRTAPLDSITRLLLCYSVIVSSGAVERSYKTIVADQIVQGASQEIDNFIDSTVRTSSQNPRKDNIDGLLNKFNKQWKKNFNATLKQLPDYNMILQSLASLVEARNAVAHGKAMACTINDVIQYYLASRRVIKIMETSLV